MTKPKKHFIRNGNYPQYYKFRSEDSRPLHFEEILPLCLNVLGRLEEQSNKKDLHLLDIGCNSGKLTKSIVSVIEKGVDTRGQSVQGIGVDIDDGLIEEATRTNGGPTIKFAQADISVISLGQLADNPIRDYMNRNSIQRFDFVTCFSVLMYIHLNHGDDGLKKVLNYLCSVANILVLELHQWRKYRDHVRRMKRESDGDYSKYVSLFGRGGQGKLEQMICNYVIGKGFKIACDQQEKNECNMSIIIFSKDQ